MAWKKKNEFSLGDGVNGVDNPGDVAKESEDETDPELNLRSAVVKGNELSVIETKQ